MLGIITSNFRRLSPPTRFPYENIQAKHLVNSPVYTAYASYHKRAF